MYDSWSPRVSEIDLREMGLDIVKGYCNMILTMYEKMQLHGGVPCGYKAEIGAQGDLNG